MVLENLKDKATGLYSDLKDKIQVTINPTNIGENGGLYFDIIQEHSISIQNQITDNYIENNTTIQDHIAQSPIIVTLRGLCGEIVFSPPESFVNRGLNALGEQFPKMGWAVDKLNTIPSLYPPVSNITQLAKDAALLIEQSVSRFVKVFQSFTQETRETKLQNVYRRLVSLRNTNALFTVETPYETFNNMAIQAINFRQGNERFVSDVELTLKQLNFASVTITDPDKKTLSTLNEQARAKETNCGKAQGKDQNVSVLIKVGRGIGNFIKNWWD